MQANNIKTINIISNDPSSDVFVELHERQKTVDDKILFYFVWRKLISRKK